MAAAQRHRQEMPIYIAGWESNGNSSIAKFWKSGKPTLLSRNGIPSVATSIFWDGSDLYVAGREFDENSVGPVVKIWENNQSIALTDGTTDAEVNSIWVSGHDVYVAGARRLMPQVWVELRNIGKIQIR